MVENSWLTVVRFTIESERAQPCVLDAKNGAFVGYQHIRMEAAGPSAIITLDRPEVHNAFDEVMIAELTQAVEHVSSEPGTRALVLTGAGESFCAGADLTWMRRMAAFTREENLADARNLRRLYMAIWECPKVTIARVNGSALGGGAGLIAACDIAIAVDSAKFGFTEVRLGLAPAVISPFVVRKIGAGTARPLFLTGDRIPASEAFRCGLVHRVVSPDQLNSAVDDVLHSVLRAGPNAVAAAKRLLDHIDTLPLEESEEPTTSCIADLRAAAEGQEGIRAFLEKRNPDFARLEP